MNLEFRRFQRHDYDAYAAWFVDPTLQHQLGPMDETWLNATLSASATEGATWAVSHNRELIAVVEIAFDLQRRSTAAITALATKPTLRRRGIGRAVLQQILNHYQNQGITEYTAFIAQDNITGQRCAEKVGFRAVTLETSEDRYIEFRHTT